MPLLPAAVTGAITDMGMGIINNELDYARSKRLQKLQIAGQKEMGEFNRQMAMRMWEDTNYGPQKEQMKKANLNPALMYGMGGSGGASTSSAPGNVGAPAMNDHTGMGIQLALLTAQKQNIEADTKLKETEAAKKAGIDTTVGAAQAASLMQGIDNQRAQELLTKAQTRIAEAGAEVAEGSIWEQIGTITYEMRKVQEEANQLVTSNAVDRATMNSKITILQNNALESWTNVLLRRAQVSNTQMDTKLKQEQIMNMVSELKVKWAQVSVAERNNVLNEFELDLKKQLGEGALETAQWNTLLQGLGSILGTASKTPVGTTPGGNIGFPKHK